MTPRPWSCATGESHRKPQEVIVKKPERSSTPPTACACTGTNSGPTARSSRTPTGRPTTAARRRPRLTFVCPSTRIAHFREICVSRSFPRFFVPPIRAFLGATQHAPAFADHSAFTLEDLRRGRRRRLRAAVPRALAGVGRRRGQPQAEPGPAGLRRADGPDPRLGPAAGRPGRGHLRRRHPADRTTEEDASAPSWRGPRSTTTTASSWSRRSPWTRWSSPRASDGTCR